MSLLDGVDKNFVRFSNKWREDLNNALELLGDHEDVFKVSYQRIASIQSWRSNIIEPQSPGGAIGFFEEAQNDLLSGHIIASAGGWRYALKSLRSFIENSLSFLYFKDHPIELELWQSGRFKIGFSELVGYLIAHPRFHGFKTDAIGVTSLKKEYGVLSRAVHASGRDFRMTREGEVNRVFLGDEIRLRKWSAREAETVNSINSLYIYFYRDLLQGACERNHRKIIGLTFPGKKAQEVKRFSGVNVILPTK